MNDMSSLSLRRPARASILLTLGLLFAPMWFAADSLFSFPANARQARPNYARQIEPILLEKCMACHNHSTRKGELNLESYDALKSGGKRGNPIVPGSSVDSLLVKMIEGTMKPQMPLGDRLSPDEIKIIKAWIDAGAPGPTEISDKEVHTPAINRDATSAIPNIKPSVPVKSAISALSFAEDGSLLAVGRYQEVELLNLGNGQFTGKLAGEASQVRALAFSPDGKLLAAAGGNPGQFGEIKLWDVAGRNELRVIRGHRDNIFAVAFSPDGRTLATCSYDRLIKLWDVASGNEIKTLKDHTDAVFSIAFSPDGKRLASASADRTVKIWDVASGQRLYTLNDALDAVNTIVFHPSGRILMGAGADRTIRLWALDQAEGRQINSLIAHEDAINVLALSPDGKLLASAGADNALKLWNATTLEEHLTIERQPDWVFALSFSPDGKQLAAGRYDGSIAIYDPFTGKKVN